MKTSGRLGHVRRAAATTVITLMLVAQDASARIEIEAWTRPSDTDVASAATGEALQAPSGVASSADAGRPTVEDINKRAQRVQEVPISVVSLAPRTLAETGIISKVQLQQAVPGISFSPSSEAKLNSFYVCGVGTYALSAALESSIGVAVDGVPLARVGGSISDLVDIERVEVLKGPQGMLFGKNATAGLFGAVTRKPELGVTGGEMHLSYGSFDELNVDAVVNIPLDDSAALRVTGWRFAHDAFVRGLDGGFGDKNSYGVRVGLTVEPTAALRLTLTRQFDGRDENGVAFTYREFTNTPPFGSLVEAWDTARGIRPSAENLVADPGPRPRSFARNYYITGLADLDLGDGYSLSSVTSYRKLFTSGQMDPRLSSSPQVRLTELTDDERYDQLTQELRIASPTSQPVSFVAGLFYFVARVRNNFNSYYQLPAYEAQRRFGVQLSGTL